MRPALATSPRRAPMQPPPVMGNPPIAHLQPQPAAVTSRPPAAPAIAATFSCQTQISVESVAPSGRPRAHLLRGILVPLRRAERASIAPLQRGLLATSQAA